MTHTRDNPPAFPLQTTVQVRDCEGNLNPAAAQYHGMSLRDYFAGQYIAGAFGGEPGSHLRAERAAADAYEVADAMLEARKVQP